MPLRRGRGRRGAAEPEDRVDCIERILEGLVQVRTKFETTKFRIVSGNSSAQQRNVVSQGSSESNELPTCPICQKKHRGECRMGTRACYGCGQEGHQIRNCPMRKRIQGAGTSASTSVQQPPTERRIISRDKVELLHSCQGIPPLPHQLCQGWDWLSSYRALIDCEFKRVVFHSFAYSGLIFEGVGIVPLPTSFLL
ncbi:hypothetical protein Acr_00g0032000 [Actinidia rufa]|uniref:CCHC-type domain-containing protein n=1 Tax=Actinidia rufa TaxID=165716 RepID=A0A7J0DFH3_9ERIC|nr:hypothetical protein Acr_00g0032000 [Actinidia rufa]